MAWNISGTYFETCSCNVICPCITTPSLGPADYDHCSFAMAFQIDQGDIEGLDVSGRKVIFAGTTPAVMSDGGWKVALLIDDGASDEATGALGKVFGGQAGGPPGALAPLVAEVLGVERVPISFTNDGTRHSVQAGSMVDMEIEDFVPPGMSDAMKIVGAGHPVASTLTVARAKQAKVSAFGLEWDNTGQNGHAAPFDWSA